MYGNDSHRLEIARFFAFCIWNSIFGAAKGIETAPFQAWRQESENTVTDCQMEDSGDLWHQRRQGSAQRVIFCR